MSQALSSQVVVTLRSATADDLPRLHIINQVSTPGVGSVSKDELERLLDMSSLTIVGELNGDVCGFILCLTEGEAYGSLNYRWVADRYAEFAYCDRIALAPEARGQGIGQQLYASAMAHFTGNRDVLLCEVNLAPPNPGSLRFHERLGFRPIGEAWSDDRRKGVVYLEKRLDRALRP